MNAKQRKQTPLFSGCLIDGYGDRYTINKRGDIFSKSKGRLLKPHVSKSIGYVMCTLINKDGSKDVCYIHQLIAITYIDKDYKSKGLVVDHIDRNRANNSLDNLRVVTHTVNSENRDAKNYRYCKDRRKFAAQIRRNGVRQSKRFTKEQDAINFIENIKAKTNDK